MMMKDPSEEIYIKSTICDFLLMVNSYTVVVILTVCKIFSYIELANRHFPTLYFDCRPLARPVIST